MHVMNFSRRHFFLGLLGLAALGFGAWCLYGLWAIHGIESPDYAVLSSADAYEVRQYDSMILATTTVSGDLESSGNVGFLRLATYIFGGNTLHQEIAMTSPVSIEQASNHRDKAESVLSESETGGEVYKVSFILPSQYTMDLLPLPTDSNVRVEAVTARTIAVLSFSGFADETTVAEKMTELADDLERDGLVVKGAMSLAQYNPPYTPWFMRQNEIWAQVLLTR